MALKHVLLKNARLKGWEYGMLRALEEEIVHQTGATVVEVPDYGLHPLTSRVGHSMRWDPARKLLPKKSFPVEADVLWYILMGPENYELIYSATGIRRQSFALPIFMIRWNPSLDW